MGVWIETSVFDINPQINQNVTPCMGVWIETVESETLEEAESVTPCMGVWIETQT